MERYELKMGKFYDKKEDKDLTRDQVLNLLNGKRINTQTKQQVAEKNKAAQNRHRLERNNPIPTNYAVAENVFNRRIQQ